MDYGSGKKEELDKMQITQSITALMVRDHERLINLLNEFKKLKNRNYKKARQLFNKLDRELKKHFILEENVFDSVLTEKTNDGSVNLLLIANSLKLEHRKIIQILRKISDSIVSDNAIIKTFGLYEILEHHRNIEESSFYPELDDLLSDKEKNYIFEIITMR